MTGHALRMLARLFIPIDRDPDQATVFVIAREQNLTFHDASHVEPAHRVGGCLATLEYAMTSAARAEGGAVVQPT